MSEPKFDVDAAAAEFDANKDDDTPPAADAKLDDDGKPITDPPADDDPPGFLSYAEYIERGGDADMYRGRKAYEAEHSRIDENKSLRRELKGLKSTVQQTMDAVNDWQSQERGKIRTELEAELVVAKENEDVNGAIETQKKLDRHDAEPAPAPAQEAPEIMDFRDANPIIDADAEEFDAEFNADVEAIYNDLAARLGQGGRVKLTAGQITRCLNKAMKEARDLHEIDDDDPPAPRGEDDPPPRQSPRNKRRGSGTPTRRRRAAAPVEPKAEDYTIDHPRNPRQKNAAPEVRDMIRNTAVNNALKAGKSEEDANKAGDQAAKNFTQSLMTP